MFRGASSLTNLNVSSWNTSNVTNMNFMFSGASNLTNLDVSNWNTNKVTYMSGVFEETGLTSLDISNWNTVNVTNISSMFSGANKLKELKLGENFKNTGDTYNLFKYLDNHSYRNIYTNKWVKKDGSAGPFTVNEWNTAYRNNSAGMSGTWVRENSSSYPQLSYVERGSKLATLGNGGVHYELDPHIKSKENIISKSLDFSSSNSVEENRIFENPSSSKIKYGLALEDSEDGIVKNDKVIITKSDKNKIEYRLLPVNTYSLNEVEPGKYQIKQTYIINRVTNEVYRFLASLAVTNDKNKDSPTAASYTTSDSELNTKIKLYTFALESLRSKEYTNHGVSTEEDIQRVVNILKEASRTVREFRDSNNSDGTENDETVDFMTHLGEEISMLDNRSWIETEDVMISNVIYGKNTTYTVIRKEDNEEVGEFTINDKGISNILALPDGDYKIVETDGGYHISSTYAEDKDLTVRTVQYSTDQVIYQATYNGKDIGNKVIVEQDGERVGKQYTVSLEEQEDKDTGLVYRPKQSSYTGTVKATNGITRVEYEPVMVNGPITFKPPFKSQVPIELFPEGSVQKGTVSKVTLTDITDENGTVWTPNITKPRAGKTDEITYSIKEVRGKSLEQEQLEQGWQKAQRTDKVEIDYGNYLLIGSFSAPRFSGTIGSPAVYMFDKRANKDITHVFANKYNWTEWDNAQIVRGANKSLFQYDLNKASFYKKDNAVKAIVETANGRIETILSKGSHGGILIETKYTNKQGKTVNFGYSRYVDTYLDNNDRVSVFSLGNNDGVYMETDKYRLDYFMKVPDAPDNFDSRFYSNLTGIETNGRKDTTAMLTPNTLLLSKTVDSGIQLGWKDKPLADGETRTMGVEVKLSFASKINSEFSRNRENWDTNTTSRELYPNLPINYDLTGTINPELLGKFTKAKVSITIPDGIELLNNTVSVLNNDNTVKATLNGTYDAQTKKFTVEVPKEQTENNSFKIRLNIKATPNVSKSYTFTEKIEVDNDINAGEKTNTSILNIVQNMRNIAVKYVDEKGNVLKDSVISSQQRGTTYNVSSVSKPTTLSFNDVSYSYLRTNGNLTGTLTDNTVISHVYRPTRGENITVKYLAGTVEVVAPLVLEGNLNARIPTVNKPEIIRKNGKAYKLSTNNTDFSNTRFTNNTQSFTVNYDEVATSDYVYRKVVNRNGVLETLGEATVIYREGDKVGTSYNLTAPETFVLNDKKYVIKNVSDKNISGQVKGTEATSVKNIEYNELITSPLKYQPVFDNVALGNSTLIADVDTVVGTNYNVIPQEITVNGLKYIPKNNNALTGVVDSGRTINVEYVKKQGNSEISYQPKFNGNNLGTPISVKNQITDKQEGATFEISPNNELTVDNKVYKLKNPTDKVRGTITQSPQTKEIEYVAKNSTNSTTYQPKLNGNNLGNTIEITPITQVGTSYNVVPKDITVDGKVYEPVSKNTLTGRVAENNIPVSVNYQPKLSVNALNYQPKVNGQPMGTPIEIVSRNSQIGTPYNVVPKDITVNGKVYEAISKTPLTGRTTSTNTPLEVEYREKTKAVKYQPKLNGNNLGNVITVHEEVQIGESYTIVPEKINLNNRVYVPVENNVRITVEDNENVKEINYKEKVLDRDIPFLAVERKDNTEHTITGDKVLIPRGTPIGSTYRYTPENIVVDSRVYEPVDREEKAITVADPDEEYETYKIEYRVKRGNTEISYQPKFNGNNLGTPISIKEEILRPIVNETEEELSQEGLSFEVSPRSEITVDNKVYKLKTPTDKVSGRITQSPQTKEIEYVAKNSNNNLVYQPKFNGSNLENTIEITPITQIGTPYSVVPKDITVDGKVYESVSKDALTGRVSENNTPLEVNYQPKLSANALNYQPKVNGQPIGTPIEVVPSNSQVGTPYNVVPKDIVVNGKVYEPVSKNALTGRTTESNTPLEVEYREKQGNTEISYQPKFNGNNLGNPISVSNQITSTQEGSTFEVSPNNEITVDNKVYKLKTPTDKVNGTITQSPQTKEIEYVAKNSTNPVVYQPKFNSNNLDNSIEVVPSNTQVGTPYDVAPREITVDGKVYEPVVKTNLTGRVLENNTPIEVNYQPKLSNTALNYQPKVNGQPIGNAIEVVPSNSQIGTSYNVVPKDITVNGKVYEPVSKDALIGRTTESNTPLEVEYRAKQGNNEISYQPKFNGNDLGSPVSVKDQITDKQEGANFEVSPNNEITVDNKVYKLKTPTDKVSGTITQSPQTKEIEYVAKDSNNNLTYQPKLNGSNLGDNIEITPIAQIGTPYNVIPKDITVDGKVYEPVSKDALTGRVSENNTPLEVNYQPKLSSNALNYQPKLNGTPIGNPIELVPSNSQVGTPYDVAPKDIIVNGKVYEPVVKDNLTGRTTDVNTPIEVEYRAKQGNSEISYQPKFNGSNLGTPISVKEQITDKQEGANFEISPNNEITVDNKVYKLKTPTDKVSGTITQSPQTKEIEYVEKNSSNGTSYQPKFNNDNLGVPIEITPITQVGTPYNVVPKDITVDGKVYEPVSKDALTGRVSENNTPLEVNYQPKLSNNALNYQPTVNGQPIGNPVEVVPTNSQIGTPYNVAPKDITVDEKVYEPVSKDALTGRTTEANTPIEVEYRAKQGNNEISYQPKFNGDNLGTPVSVKDQITDKQEGANFEITPNSEITVDNKVYKLKTPTDKVSGTITQYPQTKEIEYIAKDSNNNLVYQPKLSGNTLGDTIEITPITQIGTPYEMTPKDITVDGKVYEPVSKDSLTGRVSENNTPIEVNYQPKLSNNALNYQPKVNGENTGSPIEVVPSNSQVGTTYNVVPKDITVNGRVYEPVSKDALTGRTTESNTPLEVEYRAKQGNDEISYQPKFNGNNLGTPVSVKDQITDKQEGATFEVSPNNEITIDDKVYKLKTPTDKVSGIITQSPQTKEIEYVAKDSNNNLVYQPKLTGNDLGTPIEITPVAQIGTPYEITPKDITVDGKVYEPVSKDALTGRVSENNTPLEVNYQPKLSNNALNYQPKVNGQAIGTPIEIVPSNSQVGTPYEITPKEITIDGKVYEPVVKDNLTGRTTDANTLIEIEYRAKQGNSEISYQPKLNEDNLGTPISVKDQITDKQEGANFEVSPNNEITVDNKVYKLKTPTDKVSGTITQSPQTKEIEYVAKDSNNNLVYQPKFNGSNLGDSVEITPIAQIGTPYNVIPKEITIDGKVYEPVSKDALTGRVSENNTPIEVNYQPKLNSNALNYQPKVNGENTGTPIAVVPSNSQIGTPYELTPKDITVNGRVYEPVSKNTLTGRTTEANTPIEVEYRAKQGNDEISYQPKFNGNNLGEPVSVKDQITDKQEGANFEISPNNEITIDNKVYKLKTPTDKVSGTITQSPQTKEIEYVEKNSNNTLVYQPKVNGENLGDNIEITPIAQIGTPYTVIPKEITVDGKVYEPVSQDALTGRVSENNTPIEVSYQPKLSNKALNYQPKVNGQAIGKPIEVVPSNSQVGTPYELTPKEITIDGKVYEPVIKDKLTGRTTEDNTPIEVEYRVKQGNDEISYQPKVNNENLGTPISVKEQITDKQEGANFEISPNNEITIDNKVYKLKTPTDKVSGTITQSPQVKEIEYVAKNSNNNLGYQPKFNGTNLGDLIEIVPISQIGTPYNVIPKEITIDGKVYEPISKEAITGRVLENNTPIEVNYQPKLNSKALEYQPKVNGKELRKPIEILPSNSQIGTPYNVVPKKLLIDGKLYVPTSKEALTGKLLENNETINVEYKESKDYNDTFKQFKEIEKDVIYVSADKDKKVAYDKELENLSNLLKGEKDPSDIEKSVANLEKLKEALNGKANLLKAIEKAKEEISKLTYIIPQSDPILDMLDEPSIIDVEEITHIVEEAKELNNTVKEIVEVLDKHNENEVDYKKSTPEKKEEYNKKAKEILELLKDKNLTKEKALEKVKELNKVSDNLDGIENKQKQDSAISEIEKNTDLPKEVKEKLIKEIENTTSSEDLNKLLDKGKFIDKEIKENKNILSKQVNVANLSDKEKEEYNKALKDYENVLSNPNSTKEDIEKAKATLLKLIKEKNEVQFAKGMSEVSEKEEAFILEYKDENNKVIKTSIFPNSKKADTDLLYPKELTSDNGEKYIRNSNNTYSLVVSNSKPLENKKEKSVVDEDKNNVKSITDKKDVISTDKEVKPYNKEATIKKEELPKTSSSMLSVVGLFSIFGLRKSRKKDK